MKVNIKSENKIIQELLKISSLIHIPKADEEYKEMTAMLFKLARKVGEDKDHPLFPAMELLTLSIEHYDDEHFQIEIVDNRPEKTEPLHNAQPDTCCTTANGVGDKCQGQCSCFFQVYYTVKSYQQNKTKSAVNRLIDQRID